MLSSGFGSLLGLVRMGCALAHTRQSALASGKGCGAAAVQTLKLGASSKGAAEDEGPCVGQPGSLPQGEKCRCGDVVPQNV